MAINFPGPYTVELKYTTEGLQHSMQLNCDVDGDPVIGTVPTAINLLQRDATTIQLDVAVDTLLTQLLPQFSDESTFDEYILYKNVPESTEKTFITAGVLGDAGTSLTATEFAHQSTYTFRTQEGGVMRLVLLEDANQVKVRTPYGELGAAAQALMDYITGLTNWILARDTSYPIVPMARTGGENEAVFRKRYR